MSACGAGCGGTSWTSPDPAWGSQPCPPAAPSCRGRRARTRCPLRRGRRGSAREACLSLAGACGACSHGGCERRGSLRAGPPPVHAAPDEPCDNQRLHLGCISAASRLHLGYISAISRRTSRETISASLSRLACQKLYRISLMSSKVVKVPRMLTTSSLKLSAKRT